jgi:hypothetical protein
LLSSAMTRLYRALGKWVEGGIDAVTDDLGNLASKVVTSWPKDGPESFAEKVGGRGLRTVICSVDDSIDLPCEEEIGYTPLVWNLPIGRSKAKQNWIKLKSAWKISKTTAKE